MDREGASEPGLISGIRREEGKIEGEFRDMERNHEQREADKYESRADKDERKEEQDFGQYYQEMSCLLYADLFKSSSACYVCPLGELFDL
ncbi:unnamed protein product [Adineta steineri]|uniref:Uncharacterized protein n=1 Tax=Adineta steineri TaxID=433720 RepID=A0A819D1T4_9BILA|nr:unnamed protein product [Adineta steineri]